jgi:hypothetical protein
MREDFTPLARRVGETFIPGVRRKEHTVSDEREQVEVEEPERLEDDDDFEGHQMEVSRMEDEGQLEGGRMEDEGQLEGGRMEDEGQLEDG